MKKAQITAGVLFSILLVVLACAPKGVPTEVPRVPEVAPAPVREAPIAPAREKWEQEWELLVRGAQKEGIVVLYISVGGEYRSALVRGFEQRYGIRVEALAARGAEISEKLLTERRAGIYSADVYIGGTGPMVLMLKPGGLLDPLEPALVLPQAIDPKVWFRGQLDWVDQDHKILAFISYVQDMLAVNTELAKPAEITSYRDWLNPKWKGKIVMDDPTITGAAAKLGVIADLITGWDFIRELAKQEPVIIRDRRQQVEWVARGKYALLIAPDPTMAAEFTKIGAPIARLLATEGNMLQSGAGNVGLINRAAHPNAARVFINWLLTKEGQTVASIGNGAPSGRVDVPTDIFDPVTIPRPGVKYVSSYDEEMVFKSPEHMKRFKEILGHLIR